MQDNPPAVRVDLLALPETTPAALYGLYEILSAVGQIWQTVTGEPETCGGFDVRIVSPAGVPFLCSGGVPVEPHAGFADCLSADIVIISDQILEPDADPRNLSPETVEWLRTQHAGGATLCTVCTGAVLLAATGLLDGRNATSHWSTTPVFESFFTEVNFHRDRILVVEGDDNRLVTSGGASSWQDLCLYLIERFCGRDAAIRTSKLYLLGDRSDGQLPFAVEPRPKRHEDAIVADCQTWIADDYAADRPVTRMIERSGLKERTFKRRFRRATGHTPIAYVQNVRVEEAKQILETTAMATEAVGETVGYEDPASFRRLFKRHAGVTPDRYRQRVRRIGQAAIPSSDTD